MDSSLGLLLERIQENRLDALYLFFRNELFQRRNRQNLDRFIEHLLQVLPYNWSIQRVEVGHEFLRMMMLLHEQNKMNLLFSALCQLEALRTLIIIISDDDDDDGYVPSRKDNNESSVQITNALLTSLPNARNLVNLDVQRLTISNSQQLELLTSSLESLKESLEELRLTELVVQAPLLLDDAVKMCVKMKNLRTLAISQHQPQPPLLQLSNSSQMIRIQERGQPQQPKHGLPHDTTTPTLMTRSIISPKCLWNLCQNSTTTSSSSSSSSLQDLALRNMHLDDATCQMLSKALLLVNKNNSFLTSLDIRQNDTITMQGYNAILNALEQNYDLWCTVMVDNESVQTKCNALMELNQANRGDLIRHPTREKLATFLETVQDPTVLWYFWTLHNDKDTIFYPLCKLLQCKVQLKKRSKQQQQQQQQNQQQQKEQEQKLEDSNDTNSNNNNPQEEQNNTQSKKRQVDKTGSLQEQEEEMKTNNHHNGTTTYKRVRMEE